MRKMVILLVLGLSLNLANLWAVQNANETSLLENSDFSSMAQNDKISSENLAQNPELNFKTLFLNADIVVKGVIYILCTFSLFSWAVFFYKIYDFYKVQKSLKKECEILQNTQDLNALNLSVCKGFLDLAKFEIKKENFSHEALKLRLESKMDAQISASKSGLGALASIAASSPFIGLFGTVWGIMHSFIGIAALGNASLVVVAPGIAEALFATAFGLVAAIPAVLFYNFLLSQSVKFQHLLDECATLIYILARGKNAAT